MLTGDREETAETTMFETQLIVLFLFIFACDGSHAGGELDSSEN